MLRSCRNFAPMPTDAIQCKPLEVAVADRGIERAIKQLKRKMATEGIMKELKRRRQYMKPSRRRRFAHGGVLRKARTIAGCRDGASRTDAGRRRVPPRQGIARSRARALGELIAARAPDPPTDRARARCAEPPHPRSASV